ncbi:MAG TPA: hypothetical protein VMU94_30850 [Streptosporangiaceae bacterium]|nr:hypothetical protein [Streptosporangiaceae bacterium]
MNAGWATPEADEVQVVAGSLTDENLKRLFFAELQNPNWIEPLAALGMFATEPEPWLDEAGRQRPRPWPEGEYLARMAADEPVAVSDLLLDHATSENPWVQRVVLQAALAVPAEQAVRLVPQIVRDLRAGDNWVDAGMVVSLAEVLAPGHPRQARTLLAGAFEPGAGGEEVTVLGTRTRVVSSIDSFWFRELAPRVAQLLASLGVDGLKSAAGWLIRALDIQSDGEAVSESGHLWRPSIAPSPQNSGLHEISDALVDIVRDTASQLAKGGQLNEVIDFLEARDRGILARIAVEATAQVISADPSPPAIDVARTLLNKEELLDLGSRPEYVHLALATIPHLSSEDVAIWQEIVDAQAWQGDDDVIRQIAAYGQTQPSEVSNDDVAAIRRRMKYRLLLPLGPVLPAGLTAELTTLKTEFGDMEHPEFDIYMTGGFIGPTSPVDHDALGAMSSAELRTFLATWQPGDDHHFGPSFEGLARELEVVAETQPDLLAALTDDLLSLRRSYVRAAVAGWTKALPNGFQPTAGVWELLTNLAQLPDTGQDISSDLSADDPAWRWAQRNAADFATGYLTSRGDQLTADEATKLWAIISLLTSHADPTPQHEGKFGGSNMDAMTLSLNSTRPTAIRAAVKLLRTIAKRDDDDFSAIRAHIFDMLSEHADAANDPSLAVAAVIGESLGHIWDADRAWIEERSGKLFAVLSADHETRARADVIVSVALRIYRTGAAFLELIRPVTLSMMSDAYAALEHTDGWRGNRPALATAASHIVTAYVMGLINYQDPLVAALTSPDVSPAVISDALGTLGWSLMQAGTAEAVPPEALQRAQQLIDRRVTEIRAGRASASELAGFYWWVRAEVFPTVWSLPILQLATSDPDFNPKGMLGESLARAAEAEPALTIDVFDALMSGGEEDWKRYDLLQHAPRILAAALTCGDPAAEAKARTVLDRLGRQGHMTVLADVERLITSEQTSASSGHSVAEPEQRTFRTP